MKSTIIKLCLAAVLAQSAYQPVLAAPSFQKNYGTNRVQMVEYSDNLIIRVVGYQNQPIAIEFPKGEKLVATHGAAQINWTGNGIGDRAFLRPEANAKAGSFFIITDKHTYVFDLVPAYQGTSRSDRVSKIVFVKPGTGGTSKPLPVDVKSKGQNFQYSMQVVNHSSDIRPIEVFDDGTFTYFKFPRHSDIPAIYKGSTGTKEEWLINKHNEQDYVVVHGISAQWNLRLGNALVGVFNEAFDRDGAGVQK